MSERAKITPSHLARQAIVYLRQSSAAQVEHNRESTDRQYALADKACELGWPAERVVVIDEDLGLSGSGVAARSGFARLIAEVALARVGLVLGLEVSRLARNNAEWYRLIDLAGLTDTLIGDADGLYHPALFNDRLLLGLKGTMSEAELHVLRARLNGGIRNKAARGELRRGLPVGFVWGEEDGEIRFHPDEAVRSAIHQVFARFAETGSARRVWLWFRSEGLTFPLQMHQGGEIRWVEPSYTAIHHVLTNPVYAGAYAYGRTRQETVLNAAGKHKKRLRHLPRAEWQVLIPQHHPGFIDWQTYEANQQRLARNTRPGPHKAGGAVREGAALLQGLARCGHCGRRLHTHYRGRNAAPGYHCPGKVLVEGRGAYCLNIGGIQIDAAVTAAFIAALEPAGIAATLAAAERLERDREAALKQWRLGVERAGYEAQRAERRYRAVDPDNRLVARGLEREWEECLRALDAAKAERNRLLALGPDLAAVWNAATTTPRDRKELLRTLIEEVTIAVDRDKAAACLTLRWKGGALNEINLALPRSRPATMRTDEDTIALVRRLAVHYPDSVIAGILNRQRHSLRPSLHRRPGRQSAPPLGYSVLRADRQYTRGRAHDDQAGRHHARRGSLDHSSPAQRWHHPRRAADTRCPLADPTYRRSPGPLYRRGRRRLSSHARSDTCARRVPPDRVAACQARRTRRRTRHARQAKRPAHQNHRPTARVLRNTSINQGALWWSFR